MPRTALIVDDFRIHPGDGRIHLAGSRFCRSGRHTRCGCSQKLGDQRTDLIITDLNMPVMDGLTFIRHIRSRANSKYTPVLMLTTESQLEKKRQGKAAGATGWIVKPFTRPNFLR